VEWEYCIFCMQESCKLFGKRNFVFSGEDCVRKSVMANWGYRIRNNWPISSANSKKQVFEILRPCCCRVNQNNGIEKRATGTCHKMFICDLTRVRLSQVSVLMFVIIFTSIFHPFLIFST
jgi:hypothetical protein